MSVEGGTAVEDEALDLDRVVREIEEEVRARRASGDFPPGLERDLDLVFARYAPATSSGDDLEGMLQAAERSSFIDVDVPTESRLPGVAHVKRTLRKLMSWYLRYLAQQTSAFASTVVAALRLLGARVDALESATPAASPRVLDAARRVERPADTGPFADLVAQRVAGARDRVLVADVGDGTLLRRLVDAGVDAYGTAPGGDGPGGAAPFGAGVDVRDERALDHLRKVGDDALGGLVLAGCVDRLPLGAQLELADHAARVVAEGGPVVVLGTTPAAWARDGDPLEADLAPGRPLHGTTWAHLLRSRGFTDVEHHAGPPVATLERVAGDGDEVAAVNANLARIEEALFGPASFAVTGTRRR